MLRENADREDGVHWHRYAIIMAACIFAISVASDVATLLPQRIKKLFKLYTPVFQEFLTEGDLLETPKQLPEVTFKRQLLAITACFRTSCLGYLCFQVKLGTPGFFVEDIVIFVAWLYICAKLLLRSVKTPPYLLFLFALVDCTRWSIDLCALMLDGEFDWFWLCWMTLNILSSGAFVAVAGTLPMISSLPCENVAGPNIPPSNAFTSPEDNVTLWSWSAFKFVEPLLELASKKTLSESDVWSLSPYFRHRNLFNKRLEYQSQNPSHSLLRFLVSSNALDLCLDVVFEMWSAIVGFVPPYALKVILQELAVDTPQAKRSAFLWATAAFFANLSFAQVDLVQTWHTRRCYERTRGQLFCAIHYKALKRRDVGAKLGAVQGNENADLGKIVNIMRGDSYAVAQRFWEFSGIVATPVRLVISMVFLYKFLGWSSLASVLIVFIAWILNYPLLLKNVSITRSMLKSMDTRMNTVNELLQNVRFLKFYGWENHWSSRAQEARNDELSWRIKAYLIDTVVNFIWIWTPSATALVAFLCYTTIEGRQLTVSKAFTALSLFSYIQGSMTALPGQVDAMLKAYISMQRIEGFLSEGEVPDWASTLTCAGETLQAKDEIGFSEAVFEWDEQNQDGSAGSRFRLGPLNLAFPAGKLTVISGPTGSGKTALLLALLGEMHCISGDVNINKYHHRIAYCGQNSWLEHATIRNNITFGSSYGYEQNRYDRVIEACALKPDLEMLPAGDFTEIGEKGITLSGGQRARIALARAMYSQAQYILLDDPLAAVDMHTAQHIVKYCFMGSLARDRTIILVTHHISLCLPMASYAVELNAGSVSHHWKTPEPQEVVHEIIELESQPSGSDSSTLRISDIDMIDLGISGAPTPAHCPVDPMELAMDGRLIDAEARAEGRVAFKTYTTYIRAAGPIFLVLTVIIMLSIRLINIGNQVFIARWGEAYEKESVPNVLIYPLPHWQFSLPWDNLPAPDKDVMPWLFIYLLISIAGAVALLLNISLGYYTSIKASRALFTSLLTRITRAPARFFDTTPVGRILNRFTSDIGTIDGALQNSAKACISGVMDFIASLITIMLVIPDFAPFAVVISALYYRIAPPYIRASRDLRRLESVALSPAFSGFDELLHGITHIRAFGMEQRYQDRFYERVDHFQTFDHVYWLVNGWLRWRYDCLGSVVVYVATLFALRSGISDGLTAIVISQAAQFAEANRQLVRVLAQLELDFNSVERVMEYLAVPQEAPAIIDNSRPPAYWPSSSGELIVENLVVRYAPHLPPALKGVSFTVRASEKIGVIGRTGSGKSTLALSLLRIIESSEGRILIDGLDISKLGLEDLRKSVTIISQDVSLFAGTIRSNLDPLEQSTAEECLAVVERCHLTSVLHFTPTEEEPTILDMQISPGSLSAGEKQLVALARAILRRTNIIIMDEATSQIDINLDDRIQRTMREELQGSIVITIAHRLRTILDYDRILVLDTGKVAEFDSPKRLLQDKSSKFRQLCQKSTDWDMFASLIEQSE